MSNQTNVNKEKKLTVEELRNCKGFESFSEEQAIETINTLDKLSVMFYGLYIKHKQNVKNTLYNATELVKEKFKGKITIKKKKK